jgi:hypothetical protein
MGTAMPGDRPIAVSVAPAPSSGVEYYQSITRTVIVTNTSPDRLLVEDISLRFQSDLGQATVQIRQDCGCELGPGEVVEQEIVITPTPLFLSATNAFDVKVCFRVTGESISGPNHEVFSQPAYLIIREPASSVGSVFISLKQPQDLELGRLMARMARRAGLIPFLKAEHGRLSEHIWRDTIEPALQASNAIVVIWTSNTDWEAVGVKREIELSRNLGLREALLLATSTSVPTLYQGTSIEYTRFDADSPTRYFAEAADALRRKLHSES